MQTQPLDDRDVAPWADDRDEDAEAYKEEREDAYADSYYESSSQVY
jgi:hypothetical protein